MIKKLKYYILLKTCTDYQCKIWSHPPVTCQPVCAQEYWSQGKSFETAHESEIPANRSTKTFSEVATYFLQNQQC